MEIVERICISVNTRCNLGCKYCYFFNPENRINNEKDLSEKEIYNILLRINEYAILPHVNKKIKVNFVGSGEPLLSWKNISNAVRKFNEIKSEKIKFYTVTNGTLITDEIAEELKELKIYPSISLDGYEEIHDLYRIDHRGRGTFNKVMNGIEILRKYGFDIAINTVASKTLSKNLENFFLFLKSQNIKKVIFDRLVDVPSYFNDILTYEEYYSFLKNIHNTLIKLDLTDEIEVGNLEAYKRSFAGKPDKVCTMFGSSCGAGTNFIIYIGKEVYPCGRMFGKKEWIIGNINDSIIDIQKNMYPKIPHREDCNECSVKKYCIRDCLLEYERKDYSCKIRIDFLKKMAIDYEK